MFDDFQVVHIQNFPYKTRQFSKGLHETKKFGSGCKKAGTKTIVRPFSCIVLKNYFFTTEDL